MQVRQCLGPVEQALKDAGALNADQELPAEVAMRVIPGLCRTAVEAALTQAVWRQQLRDGHARAEIEAGLTQARRRRHTLAAFAFFGDLSQGAKVLPRLNGLGRMFADTFQALNRGATSHMPVTWGSSYPIAASSPANPRPPAMTPADLLAAARALITRPDTMTAGVWPRTAALLARQALEQAISAHWETQPDTSCMADCPTRAQLICLPWYIDTATAGQITYTWAVLSSACHYHPYELAPTAAELISWIGDVAELLAAIAADGPVPPGP